MPSPGANTIESDLFPLKYTVEGGHKTEIMAGWSTATRLSSALDAGWTSVSPSTASSMETAITSEFDDLSEEKGYGVGFLKAIGVGIDQETKAWVDSWNASKQAHEYEVTADKINAAILAATPITSNAVTALSLAVSIMFAGHFEQNAG